MLKIKKEIIEALKYLKEYKCQISEASKKFNIDRHTISKYAEKDISNAVFYENYYYIFDEKELIAINDYVVNNLNLNQIKKKYGYYHETFKRKLTILSINENNHLKSFDINFFDEINNEEKAYVLGFILADGYINEDKGFLRIKISNKDVDILKKICNCLKFDEKEIKKETHTQTLNINNYITLNRKDIVKKLKTYNIHQSKSGKEIPYTNIDNSLKRHYIRGIFDGDGHISSNFDTLGFCGSFEVLYFIKTTIEENVKLKFRKNVSPKIYKDGNIFKLKYYGINIRNILNWMYSDSVIFLDRKYNIYLKEKHVRRLK